MIRGNPWGSHVVTGSLESPTGTERGPYSGLAASKRACPLSVIGAGGSRVFSGPNQTPFKSGSDFGAVAGVPGDPPRQPGSAAESANKARVNRRERIEC